MNSNVLAGMMLVLVLCLSVQGGCQTVAPKETLALVPTPTQERPVASTQNIEKPPEVVLTSMPTAPPMLTAAVFPAQEGNAETGPPELVEAATSVPPALEVSSTPPGNSNLHPTSMPVNEAVSNRESASEASARAVFPLPSLEDMIDVSYVITRAVLLSVDTRLERIESAAAPGGDYYLVFLEFEFKVLEYLKGHGNSVIWASVLAGDGFDTTQDAQAAALEYWAARDKYLYSRWDDREAIVFLSDEFLEVKSPDVV